MRDFSTQGRGSYRWLGTLAALVALSAPAQDSTSARYTQSGKGLLTAPAFTSPPTQAGTIDIADLLVGPHQVTASNKVGVGAIIEVQAGAALITVNGRQREVVSGTIVSLKPGDVFSIDNRRQPRPLVARLIRIGDVGGATR